MSQHKHSAIQQREIENVYHNRHAEIVRQTSRNSDNGSQRIPSVSRSVSQDEDTLILDRTPVRTEGYRKTKEFKPYSNVRLDSNGDNPIFPPIATSKERWRILSGSSTIRSNSMPVTSAMPDSKEVVLDDVFVEEPSRYYSPVGVAIHSPVSSTSSTASVLQRNPYNVWNHKVHDVLWCSCCMYFFLLCCIPAVVFMEKSDSAHKELNDKEAFKYGKLSTKLFIFGSVSAVILYALILFLVIYTTTVLL